MKKNIKDGILKKANYSYEKHLRFISEAPLCDKWRKNLFGDKYNNIKNVVHRTT